MLEQERRLSRRAVVGVVADRAVVVRVRRRARCGPRRSRPAKPRSPGSSARSASTSSAMAGSRTTVVEPLLHEDDDLRLVGVGVQPGARHVVLADPRPRRWPLLLAQSSLTSLAALAPTELIVEQPAAVGVERERVSGERVVLADTRAADASRCPRRRARAAPCRRRAADRAPRALEARRRRRIRRSPGCRRIFFSSPVSRSSR